MSKNALASKTFNQVICREVEKTTFSISTKYNEFSNGTKTLTLFKAVMSLSTKLSLAQIAPLAMSFYVAGLVGKLGALAFSAYSLVAALNLTIFIAAINFLQSLYVVCGRTLATNDSDGYKQSIGGGIAVAIGLAALATIISCSAAPIFSLLGLPDNIVASASALGYAAALGILPALLLNVFRVHASLQGYAGLVTAIYIIGAIAATAGCVTVLTYPHGDPINAAIWITLCIAVSNWGMLAIAMGSLKFLTQLQLSPTRSLSIASSTRALINIGWPIGAVVFLDSFAFLFTALLTGRFWPEQVPANSAASLWITILLVIPLGIAQAAVQKIAVLHAQGNITDRNKVAMMTITTGLVIGLTIAGLFSFYAVELGHLLLSDTANDATVINGLQQLMPLAGVLFACQAVIVIAAAILRGIGQTRVSLVQAIIGYGVIATGAQLLFAVFFHQAATGAWWGLICGFFITMLAIVRRCIIELRMNGQAGL